MAGKSGPVGVGDEMGAASSWRTPKHHPHGSPLRIDEGSCRCGLGLKSQGPHLQIDGKADDMVDGNGWRTPSTIPIKMMLRRIKRKCFIEVSVVQRLQMETGWFL
ncbi:hypothetical protein GUJ93_ZPchr0003g16666 [Zizania palustris]|uniref:Uncharacterized protein n=1 Tax=Zizania palustris TaxID=103762 RepID=A0A8J5VX89_ZIZPA|nr:hypothetical protein GUJ93_ZPchr0003g16666 [Zizania palustris]